MGLLLERFLDWCCVKGARTSVFASKVVADARLHRRVREMERYTLLAEVVFSRHSISFMLEDPPADPTSPDIVYVRALSASRPYDEDQRRRHEDLPTSAQLAYHTVRMETQGMLETGWKVNVREHSCSCLFHQKFACCIHVLFALNSRGHIDLYDRVSCTEDRA
ncbi:SWIM zinc finger domain-containing protein [Phytophthora infestans]|uniref:SWIM zinc finger domain-containing protein n=1 Tax=Phytophthora infestans TaxID=4787 RepID=A0A833W7V2_PHYIN|nr:SWIM zinc finger domain-containing protein [Phytophthora infestans]